MPNKPAPQSLAEFELLVLLAALRLGPDEAYTVSIADHIQQRTGRSVRRANVYTTLQRLEAKRLVTTRLGEPRRRAWRQAAPAGRRCVRRGSPSVRATAGAIQSMVGELGEVLGETR